MFTRSLESPSRPGPALLVTLGLLVVFGAYMYWAQNVGHHQGGAISPAKAVWLTYAISAFFVLPWAMWRDERVAPALRFLFGVHLLSWCIRGVIELYLMYALHAWIPPYGVYHGVFNLSLLAVLAWQRREALKAIVDPVGLNARLYMLILCLTGCAEMVFAELFYSAVGHDTRYTWFANAGASFAFINWLTTSLECIFIPLFGFVVWRHYRPAATPPASVEVGEPA